MKDLEETLAFAERVAAVKPIRIDALTQIDPSKTVKPKDQFSDREEIRQHLADFKAIQHRFAREREEYFKKTMAKVRVNSARS